MPRHGSQISSGVCKRNRYESIAARQMTTLATNFRSNEYLANLQSFYETHFHP